MLSILNAVCLKQVEIRQSYLLNTSDSNIFFKSSLVTFLTRKKKKTMCEGCRGKGEEKWRMKEKRDRKGRGRLFFGEVVEVHH